MHTLAVYLRISSSNVAQNCAQPLSYELGTKNDKKSIFSSGQANVFFELIHEIDIISDGTELSV